MLRRCRLGNAWAIPGRNMLTRAAIDDDIQQYTPEDIDGAHQKTQNDAGVCPGSAAILPSGKMGK